MDPVSKGALATTAVAQPVIWSLLGYQFEAASMIAGLSACLMVRVWVSLKSGSRKTWALDLTIMGIALLFTAGWIVHSRPEPFYALLSGTGFGALGAGIIAIALAWLKKAGPLVGLDDGKWNAPLPPATTPEDLRHLFEQAFPTDRPRPAQGLSDRETPGPDPADRKMECCRQGHHGRRHSRRHGETALPQAAPQYHSFWMEFTQWQIKSRPSWARRPRRASIAQRPGPVPSPSRSGSPAPPSLHLSFRTGRAGASST